MPGLSLFLSEILHLLISVFFRLCDSPCDYQRQARRPVHHRHSEKEARPGAAPPMTVQLGYGHRQDNVNKKHYVQPRRNIWSETRKRGDLMGEASPVALWTLRPSLGAPEACLGQKPHSYAHFEANRHNTTMCITLLPSCWCRWLIFIFMSDGIIPLNRCTVTPFRLFWSSRHVNLV